MFGYCRCNLIVAHDHSLDGVQAVRLEMQFALLILKMARNSMGVQKTDQEVEHEL